MLGLVKRFNSKRKHGGMDLWKLENKSGKWKEMELEK